MDRSTQSSAASDVTSDSLSRETMRSIRELVQSFELELVRREVAHHAEKRRYLETVDSLEAKVELMRAELDIWHEKYT